MEMKKLSNLVIDFFRNDIVWLVFYLAFAATERRARRTGSLGHY